MKCPACKTPDLLMTERRSIEIDYCPQCRGVWLDRGELDKIIERTGSVQEPSPSQPTAAVWTQPGAPPPHGGVKPPPPPPPRHNGSSPRARASTATIMGTAVRSESPGWRRFS